MTKFIRTFAVAAFLTSSLALSAASAQDECKEVYAGSYPHGGSICHTTIEDCTREIQFREGGSTVMHTTMTHTFCADGRTRIEHNIWSK
jgi:hypothetical protein